MSSKEISKIYGPGLAECTLYDGNKCVDANYTTDAPARYANDSRGSHFINNADLTGRNYKYKLKSKKRIKPHEEIFTNYGKDYWKYK